MIEAKLSPVFTGYTQSSEALDCCCWRLLSKNTARVASVITLQGHWQTFTWEHNHCTPISHNIKTTCFLLYWFLSYHYKQCGKHGTGTGAVYPISLVGGGIWASVPVMLSLHITNGQLVYRPGKIQALGYLPCPLNHS